jgi:hypothetical protein
LYGKNTDASEIAANADDDAMQICFSIIGAAMLICGDDASLKSAVAWFMRRMASKLDHDVADAPLLEPSFRDLKQFRSFSFRVGLFRGSQSFISAVTILINFARRLHSQLINGLAKDGDTLPHWLVGPRS